MEQPIAAKAVLCTDADNGIYISPERLPFCELGRISTGAFINQVEWSPDNANVSILVSSSDEKQSGISSYERRLYNVETKQLLLSQPDAALTWSSSGKYAAIYGGLFSKSPYIIIWSTVDKFYLYPSGAERITQIAFSPDGTWLAVQRETSIELWNLASRLVVRKLSDINSSSSYWNMAWSPDSRYFSTDGKNCTISVWDLLGPAAPKMIINDVCYSSQWWNQDSIHLVVSDRNNNLQLWNLMTQRIETTFSGQDRGIVKAGWSPDGELLYSVGIDGETPRPSQVIIWDIATKRIVADFENSDWAATGMEFTPDGSKFIIGQYCCGADLVRTWDRTTGSVTGLVQGPGELTMDLNHDRSLIAFSRNNGDSGTEKTLVYVQNVSTGALIATLDAHTDAVNEISWSPNGEMIITVDWQSNLIIWKFR